MMGKYIVTGGLGFIGYHLCKKLLEEGHIVISIDLMISEKYNRHNLLLLSNYEKFLNITLDINKMDQYIRGDEEGFYRRFKDIDGIFHLAALPRVQYSFDNPIPTTDTNIGGTIQILEMARRLNIPRVVFASSSTAKTEMSPYGIQKRTGEKLMDLYNEYCGISTINLRFFSVYGSNMDEEHGYALLIPKLIHCANTGDEFTLYGDGSVERDFTFIDDIISGCLLAMNSSISGTLELGNSNPVSVKTVIETVENITEKKIKIKQEAPRVEPKITRANNLFAERRLGWTAKTKFSDGIKICIEEKNGV